MWIDTMEQVYACSPHSEDITRRLLALYFLEVFGGDGKLEYLAEFGLKEWFNSAILLDNYQYAQHDTDTYLILNGSESPWPTSPISAWGHDQRVVLPDGTEYTLLRAHGYNVHPTHTIVIPAGARITWNNAQVEIEEDLTTTAEKGFDRHGLLCWFLRYRGAVCSVSFDDATPLLSWHYLKISSRAKLVDIATGTIFSLPGKPRTVLAWCAYTDRIDPHPESIAYYFALDGMPKIAAAYPEQADDGIEEVYSYDEDREDS